MERAAAAALVGALGLAWCTSCGRVTADRDGDRAAVGPRVAVRSGSELSLVEFSDLARPRVTLLTDHLWSIEPLEEDWFGSAVAWSPSGAVLAWANDDGTVSALAEGRIVDAPVEPTRSVGPGVHFLDEEAIAIHPVSRFWLWRPVSGDFDVGPADSFWRVSGGGYLYCQGDQMYFVSKSGAVATWDRYFDFELEDSGEHIALFVPEAGRSGTSTPVVSEIVIPAARELPLDCELPPTSGELEGRASHVQWSASGKRVGGIAFEGWPAMLRVGSSPLEPSADAVAVERVGTLFYADKRRPWSFDGEEARFVRGLPADVDWPAHASILEQLAVDGTRTVLGQTEVGEHLVGSFERTGAEGALFVAEVWPFDRTAAYLLGESGQLVRLRGELSADAWGLRLRPQPDGPGVAISSAIDCPTPTTCVDPETFVWPDPDADPDDFFTLRGDARWVPGEDGLVVVSDGEVSFVRLGEPEELHHLASGDDVLVAPAPLR